VNRLPDAMSDQDQVKPYHAKNAAPGQEAADVVAEVLQHAQEREEAAKTKTGPKTPPKWMLPLTVNLGVLALYFLIAQPEFLVVNPVTDPRVAAEVDQAGRASIYTFAITPIENFRGENGRLPGDLAEAGSPLASQGLVYTVTGDSTYTLAFENLTFDSSTDDSQIWAGVMNLGG
jgi:hypothetical protein